MWMLNEKQGHFDLRFNPVNPVILSKKSIGQDNRKRNWTVINFGPQNKK